MLAEVDLSVPMLSPAPAPAPHYLHGFGHMSGELRGGPGPRPVPVMSTSSSSLHTLEVKIARLSCDIMEGTVKGVKVFS